VPFSGLIAFVLFNTIASNLQLNRLVRFNIQQAILLDIALIFPGIIGTVASIGATQGDFELPSALVDSGSTATFLAVSAAIIYSMGSSLIGTVPDKIPIISERVKLRVPTGEEILKILGEQEKMVVLEEELKKEKKIHEELKRKKEREEGRDKNDE
jgi:hypothetical protein